LRNCVRYLLITRSFSDQVAALDIEGPWTFHLRNPKNPKQLNTHAGVLEFIAEEGIVHLPAWVSQLRRTCPPRS